MKKTAGSAIIFILITLLTGFIPMMETEPSPEITAEPLDLTEEQDWFRVPVISGSRAKDTPSADPDPLTSEDTPLEITALSIDPAEDGKEIFAPDAFAASIDGITYTIRQFWNHAIFLRLQYLESYAGKSEDFLAYGIPLSGLNSRYEELLGPAGREEFLKETAEHLIFAAIIETEGKNAGLAFTDAEILEEQKKMTGLFEKQEFPAQISEEYDGISQNFLKDIAMIRLYESALFRQAMQEHHFEEEMVDLSHILTDDEKTAWEIKKRLKTGESWDELAAAYSMDTYTKDEHGALGWIRRTDIDKTLADAAFSLEPGTVSDPVQTVFGYHILASAGKEIRPLEGDALEKAHEEYYFEWENRLRKNHLILIDMSSCRNALPEKPVFIPKEEPEDTVSYLPQRLNEPPAEIKDPE